MLFVFRFSRGVQEVDNERHFGVLAGRIFVLVDDMCRRVNARTLSVRVLRCDKQKLGSSGYGKK